MGSHEIANGIRYAVRDGIARTLAAIGLLGIALIHLLDVSGKFSETPYLAWMYVGLIVASVVLASAFIRTSHPRAWKASAALAASVLLGFALSRTIGLPQSSDDIGNWGEPLGVASLFVEGSVLALSAGILVSQRGAGVRARRSRMVPDVVETLRTA